MTILDSICKDLFTPKSKTEALHEAGSRLREIIEKDLSLDDMLAQYKTVLMSLNLSESHETFATECWIIYRDEKYRKAEELLIDALRRKRLGSKSKDNDDLIEALVKFLSLT